jgi:hypothetical protein
LIDVVVPNEYPQNVSNLPPALDTRRQAVDEVSRSTHFEIVRRLLAAVADQLIIDRFTLFERAQAGALDRRNTSLAASYGRNESEHFAGLNHFTVPVAIMTSFAKADRGRTIIARPPIRSQRCSW